MSLLKEWKFVTLLIVLACALGILVFGGPFKRGMDIAGGVELTYQIDLSKYRTAYPNDAEYQLQVQNAKNIIKENITKRVNNMGVGDTEVRLLKVGDRDYIVVKVGGIDDIEQAKATIGRTVELEFKLPNTVEPTPEDIAARKKAAEELLVQVVASPDQMKNLGESRGSDDIYYESIIRAYSQLPQVYQDNRDVLENLSGVANQVIEGVYGQQQDGSGNIEEVQGFFIIKVNSFNVIPSPEITATKVEAINQAYNTTTTLSYLFNEEVGGDVVATGVVLSGETLIAWQNLYPNARGYRASIYAIPNSGGLIDNGLIAQITGALLENQNISSISGYQTILDNQWIDESALQSLQTGLIINNDQDFIVISNPEGAFLVHIMERKATTDSLLGVYTITGSTQANRASIINDLTTERIYNVEHIFVRDRAAWQPAVESKFNRVLNGAYFQSATITQGQTGLPVVAINFNAEGSEVFCNLTEQAVGKQMGIFVGGKLVTAPTIREKICAGTATIDGMFTDQVCTDPKDATRTYTATSTREGAMCLVSSLNEGALPAPLILSNESTLAASLGDRAWQSAGYATVAGLILVFGLLMSMYGPTRAILASLSLIAFLIVLLAVVKLTDYALSLSGIAAIILNIGMGIDSSILILERLAEEKQKTTSRKQAIMNAYDRSWEPIFDGNITTGIIGFIMALVGSDIFQGFGMMMAINNALLLLIAVPMMKYLLLWWLDRNGKI